MLHIINITPPGQTDYLRVGDQPRDQHIRHEQSLQRGHLQVDYRNGILAMLVRPPGLSGYEGENYQVFESYTPFPTMTATSSAKLT